MRVGRGVRQGYSLSPLLFNFFMDLVLSYLDPKLGVCLSQALVLNHLAFADDVALVAGTPAGLETLADQFERALATVGLRPNQAKSATLLVHDRRKKWVCGSESFLVLNDSKVPALSVADGYKYLGTSATLGKVRLRAEERLAAGLNNLRRAPLKPQQRMFILRTQLIPSLFHGLVLGDRGSLERMDKDVRKAVRE